MLMGVLAHIGNPAEDDDRVTRSIVGELKAALPAGSYLAIYDSANVDRSLNEALRDYNESGAAPYRVRTPEQIRSFFDGLELVDPGVVPIQQWRQEHSPFGPPKNLSNNLGGVARKVLSTKPDTQSSRTDAWVPAQAPFPPSPAVSGKSARGSDRGSHRRRAHGARPPGPSPSFPGRCRRPYPIPARARPGTSPGRSASASRPG
jgi:hypothetical protein